MTHPYGKNMVYQYSILGRFLNFPWKHYYKHGRGIRYITLALIVSYPAFLYIHKSVNSPGNVAKWKEIRANRKHDIFARPVEK